MSGEVLSGWMLEDYLLAKFISNKSVVGEFAMRKEVIKTDSHSLIPARGRPLIKAMLRGL